MVDEQPNPEYQKVKTDLEDITRLYDGYVQRMEGGGILSPAEAADMDDLEDIQYRLEKELDELRPGADLYPHGGCAAHTTGRKDGH